MDERLYDLPLDEDVLAKKNSLFIVGSVLVLGWTIIRTIIRTIILVGVMPQRNAEQSIHD